MVTWEGWWVHSWYSQRNFAPAIFWAEDSGLHRRNQRGRYLEWCGGEGVMASTLTASVFPSPPPSIEVLRWASSKGVYLLSSNWPKEMFINKRLSQGSRSLLCIWMGAFLNRADQMWFIALWYQVFIGACSVLSPVLKDGKEHKSSSLFPARTGKEQEICTWKIELRMQSHLQLST